MKEYDINGNELSDNDINERKYTGANKNLNEEDDDSRSTTILETRQNDDDYDNKIEKQAKKLIASGDYQGAYILIFNSYSDINEGLVLGQNYNVLDNKHLIAETDPTAFNTASDPIMRPNGNKSNERTSPYTQINPKTMKKLLNGSHSFGFIVRSIYHETVHARLMLGLEKGFPGLILSYDGLESRRLHETIAYSLALMKPRMPNELPREIAQDAGYGLQYYNSLSKKNQDLLKDYGAYLNRLVNPKPN